MTDEQAHIIGRECAKAIVEWLTSTGGKTDLARFCPVLNRPEGKTEGTIERETKRVGVSNYTEWPCLWEVKKGG